MIENARPRLLVIEDYTPTRLILEADARACGLFADVQSAPDAEEAKNYIQNCLFCRGSAELPHVVLSDLYLPGANGIELLLHLRQQPATAGIIGSIMTVSEDPWERRAVESAGFTFYQKPTSSLGLRKLMASLVSQFPVAMPVMVETNERAKIETIGCRSVVFAFSTSDLVSK